MVKEVSRIWTVKSSDKISLPGTKILPITLT